MNMCVYVTGAEVYDEAMGLVARVSAVDDGAARVELKQEIHDELSWKETAKRVGQAIKMLELAQ